MPLMEIMIYNGVEEPAFYIFKYIFSAVRLIFTD